MPATPNIIDQLGTSWKLTVQEFAVYSYQHPTFGYLEYVGRTAWLCDNVNTVWLTQQGSLPDNVLPPSICIRPKYDGECGTYDVNGYTPPEAKCLCKDPECPFDLPLYLTCAGVTESCVGHFVPVDGETTVCDAAGPVYVAECTLNSVLMRVRIYCDGTGQWYADVLNDGVLCDSCIALSPTFCPLVMGGGTAEPCDNDCVPCIGPDCEPSCDATDCTAYPAQMTITFTSACASLSGKTAIMDNDGFGGLTQVGGTLTGWSVSGGCSGGVWLLSLIDVADPGVDECAVPTLTSIASECDPVSVAFDTQTITDITGCSCIGNTVTASMSS